MKLPRILAAAFLLPLALAAFAPARPAEVRAAPARAASDPVLERILALGREDNRVQEHLQTLCKSIGPRLTGTTLDLVQREGTDDAATSVCPGTRDPRDLVVCSRRAANGFSHKTSMPRSKARHVCS